MSDKVVYLHRREDNNQVFYVGIGSINRPKSTNPRSKLWDRVVSKYGCIIEVIAKNLPSELACKIEIALIKEYGRRDLGLGYLVNHTDGGEGITGCPRSEEVKRKISKALKGRITNHVREVINNETGEIFRSIQAAADSINLNRRTLNRYVKNNKIFSYYVR